MSNANKVAKDLRRDNRRRRDEGVCQTCDCDVFQENMFCEAICRCTHSRKKHSLDPLPGVSDKDLNIEEDIETIKELGQGANGTVYKAKHLPSGKVFALKRVKLSSDTSTHELLKEISIMNNCESENIVDFFGAIFEKKTGDAWIAMEYCSGGSLVKLMERRGRAYTEEEVSVITRNVLKALVYMHMSRRCHRDIKPENILLSGRGVPKLADFGISVQMGKGMQQMATLIGTPIFLAPEIITSDGYNTKVDVWALGISCIILADGVPPYGADVDPVRAMFLISQSKEPPTLQVPAEWSAELNDFLEKCLAREPANRWTSLELLSHGFIARHCDTRTVSTSVKHDKVQTVGSGKEIVLEGIERHDSDPLPPPPIVSLQVESAKKSSRRQRRSTASVDSLKDMDKENKEKEKKDKDEKERKDKEKKDKEEKDKKDKRDKEEKEKRDKQEKDKRDKEEKDKKEKKDKEDKDKREKEEKDKREKEERDHALKDGRHNSKEKIAKICYNCGQPAVCKITVEPHHDKLALKRKEVAILEAKWQGKPKTEHALSTITRLGLEITRLEQDNERLLACKECAHLKTVQREKEQHDIEREAQREKAVQEALSRTPPDAGSAPSSTRKNGSKSRRTNSDHLHDTKIKSSPPRSATPTPLERPQMPAPAPSPIINRPQKAAPRPGKLKSTASSVKKREKEKDSPSSPAPIPNEKSHSKDHHHSHREHDEHNTDKHKKKMSASADSTGKSQEEQEKLEWERLLAEERDKQRKRDSRRNK